MVSTFFSIAQKQLGNLKDATSDSITISTFSLSKIPITDSIINYGKLFLNKPYRYGAGGDSAFDCSGFTSFVYRNFGYNLLRSSAEQAQQFDSVHRHQLKVGDLVYFAGRRRSKHVGHVGIVTNPRENGAFDFIHAAVRSGVIISSSEEAYYTQRFVKANRVIGNNSLLNLPTLVNLDENLNNSVITPVPFPVKQTKTIVAAKYHKVKSGETLSSISEKYGLSVAQLKRKNHLRGSTINPKQRLKIKDEETIMIVEPMNQISKNENIQIDTTSAIKTELSKSNLATNTSVIKTHFVKKGETLFSISKKYAISIDDLKKRNNLINSNIQPNQEIKLGADSDSPEIVQVEATQEAIKYKVKKGESLFSISKKYKVTIDELKSLNNLVGSDIRPGQELIINKTLENKQSISEKGTQITHKVKSGESFFYISKKYSCSIDNIKEWNGKSGSKINIGDKLVIFQK